MAARRSDVLDWILQLPEDVTIRVDGGGLSLVAHDNHNRPTGGVLEVGGCPEECPTHDWEKPR